MLSSKKSEFGEAVNELTNLKNYSLDYHIVGYKPSDLARDQWAAEIIWIPIHCHDWLEISKKLGMSLQILAKQAIVNSDSEIVEHKLKPLFACLRSLVQNLSPLKQGW